MKFTHLHTHSHYSLLDGLPKISELLDRAKELEMDSLALTDHGAMYGLVEFYQTALEMKIKPILGVEAYVAQHGRKMKRPKIDTKPYHLILLAKNEEGYQNLIKLTTLAHIEGYYYKPRIDWEILRKYSRGLIACSACVQGQVDREIINGDFEKARQVAKKYRDLFGEGNYYLEVQPHPNLEDQKTANDGIFKLAQELSIPLVSTNDVHYLRHDDDKAQDVLICIQTQRTVDEKQRLSMVGEDFSMKPAAEMLQPFADHPEIEDNIQKIVQDCNVDLDLGLDKKKLPYFAVPKGYSSDDYLRKLAEDGILDRYDTGDKKLMKRVGERLDYELGVIAETGFANCFLFVQDFVNYAKSKKIMVGPGRGSAAGSITSYLLKITNIEPIGAKLIFERFLNKDRVSLPDFDIDFADTRRDEVLKYVVDKYGANHVCQVITFGTMAARAAIRDAGRALGLPYSLCDETAKMIPMFTSLDEALNKVSEFKAKYNSSPEAKKLVDMARKLEDVCRHSSTHACGVVSTALDLDKYIPRQIATTSGKGGEEVVVTQYSVRKIDDHGFMVLDFLGLKNLSILERAIKIIKKTKGRDLDLNDIPKKDETTFKLLQEGKTTGVFQLESAGMKRHLKSLKPTVFNDIVSMVALYRPGPMEWIPDFVAGKHGLKKVEYLHPKLEPILSETYGIAIFQEQIMQIARDLAGFSLSEADVLRKAVGKKIKQLLAEQKKKFIEGCVKNGIAKKTAQEIFRFIEPFAGYGFNRSHATGYAMIAYQTAYLKAHYPTEFMAALLASDQENTDRVAIEIAEAEQMGIKVLPPDVNESFADFTVVDDQNIRFGLAGVKNLGNDVIAEIIRAREAEGKFASIDDFVKRVRTRNFNKKSLEALAKSGALDKMAERNQVLGSMEKILTYARTVQKAALAGQTDLFGGLSGGAAEETDFAPKLKLDEVEPAPKKDRLAWEKELLGQYVSDHPLSEYKDYLLNRTTSFSLLREKRNQDAVTVGGIITKIKPITTKRGDPMMFVTMEDVTGQGEILVFPRTLKESAALWVEGKILLVSGKLSDKDGEMKVLADSGRELSQAEAADPRLAETEGPRSSQSTRKNNYILLSLPRGIKKEQLNRLKVVLEKNDQSGENQVIIELPHGGDTREIKTNYKIEVSKAFRESVGEVVGTDGVVKWYGQD